LGGGKKKRGGVKTDRQAKIFRDRLENIMEGKQREMIGLAK